MNDRSPQMRLIRWIAPLTTLIVAIVLGTLYGVQLVVLTLAGGALLLVIALLWNSVQALAGESELSFEEAFSMGARSAEEEQKRAVLRALKDLDYERSVGKISEEDFHEYSARYRAEAKRLIRDLDENLAEARKQVEREVERRIGKQRAREAAQANEATSEAQVSAAVVVEATSSPENPPPSPPESSPRALRECTACKTQNELDARFCKACGAAMTASDERLCRACPARFAGTTDECPECGTRYEESS